MECNKRNRKIRYATFRDSNLNRISNVLPNQTRSFSRIFCDRFSKLKRFFPFLDPIFFYIFGRFVKTKRRTKCRTKIFENGSKMF